MTRIKSPYIKQLIQFAILAACVAGLNWFDARLTVDMPDPRGFDIYMKVFALVVLIAAVTIGSLLAMMTAAVLKSAELKLLGVTFLVLYIVMHSVFLLSLRAHTRKSASLSGEWGHDT